MDQSQSNVNANITLSQFSFNVLLMDSYSTDYYDIQYPGLIMKVRDRTRITYDFVVIFGSIIDVKCRDLSTHIT